jgi:hypothetical protein
MQQQKKHTIQADLITVITDGHQTNEDDQTGLTNIHQMDIQCLNNSGMDTSIIYPKVMIQLDGDSKIG